MNRKSRRLGLTLAAALVPGGSLMALPWDEDMRNSPSVKPQEAQVYSNPAAVPLNVDEPFDPPANVSELVRARLTAGDELVNPVPISDVSLQRGMELYGIHCFVCHGTKGEGDGPVGTKYSPQPMNLLTDYVKLQKDGQLFYTITNGGVMMPIYRESIGITDRWHLVNYVKNALGQGAQ